jgi:hypothetical protein
VFFLRAPSTIFGVLLIAFVAIFLMADIAVFFAYIPYSAAVIPAVVCLALFTNKESGKLSAICIVAFSAWVLFVLPRMRTSELKAFYVDAWSLKAGMTVDEVDAVMSQYTKNPSMPFADAVMIGVNESGEEHASRILYIHQDYLADWCVIYPKDGIVRRVEIHPD